MCIGAYANDYTVPLPYKRFSELGLTMEGLPEDVILKHPSNYGIATMKKILAKKDDLRITCML